MASRIRILPEQLANMIAAGEVVERPASVVKELVENALDAGARQIRVDIEGGGKRLIRVTDDGCGMGEEDLLLSVERHATSKIRSSDDLFALSSLGFRGEALPSIASVSRMYLRSRPAGAISGRELYLEGGVVRHFHECGMAPGTVVEVRSLFFNTPARLKFMKSNETEAGHVADLIARLSLAALDVRFTLVVDGRETVRAFDPTLTGRVAEVLGKGVTDLHPFRLETPRLTVHGLLSSPSVTRSNPGYIHSFINGRFVRDKVVQHAIMAPYRSTLEKGRYPVVIIFIQIPPGEVDVNVHPTKHEVRFRDQGGVHDAISRAIAEGLTSLHPAPPLRFSPPSPTPSPSAADRLDSIRETLARYAGKPETRHPPLTLTYHPAPPSPPHLPERDLPPRWTPPPQEVTSPADLEIIGQFRASYILCRQGEDLLIIDQHAAHERVRFEELRAEFSRGSLERQGLLFPLTLHLSHHQGSLVREHEALLDLLGFTIEEFGGGSWVVKEVPCILASADIATTLVDILDEIGTIGRSTVVQEKVDSLLMKIACHGVVRGVHPLSLPEIETLLETMATTDRAGFCPHGRPVIARILRREIERLFKR